VNRPILSSPHAPEILRDFVTAVIPPYDLYDRLIEEEIDVSKKGLIKRVEFQNKYVGRHDVGILLEKFTANQYFMHQRYDLKLRMEINFYVDNKLILSRLVENKYYPFLGIDRNGFDFIDYNCPKDLPIKKSITCEVKIIMPDPTLKTVYGPVWLYIRKASDK
jgi:hypothetical protein